MAFARIRGPIGGDRDDAYALMQAAFTNGQRRAPKDFMWWLVEPRNPDDDIDDTYMPSAEERAWAAAMA